MVNRKQALLGGLFLIAGVLEYLIGRPSQSVLFLAQCETLNSFFLKIPHLYGPFGNYAPDFFHPLAFSLLSMALVSGRKARAAACLIWFTANSLFELGQNFGASLSKLQPAWFKTLPGAIYLNTYFQYSRFDWFDMLAIALGSATAFFIGEITTPQGGVHGSIYSPEGLGNRYTA